MTNIIFYFLLLPGFFSGPAIARAPENGPSCLDAQVAPTQNLPSSFSYPNLPNTCDITSGCFYSTVSNFQCGESKVVVTSACVSKDQNNSDPYCYFQNVAFFNSTLERTKSFNYNYETDNKSHVSSATCIKTKTGFYVALENTNLGNCKTCEWNDYFDEKGRYVGSEHGIYGNTSLARKSLH